MVSDWLSQATSCCTVKGAVIVEGHGTGTSEWGDAGADMNGTMAGKKP